MTLLAAPWARQRSRAAGRPRPFFCNPPTTRLPHPPGRSGTPAASRRRPAPRTRPISWTKWLRRNRGWSTHWRTDRWSRTPGRPRSPPCPARRACCCGPPATTWSRTGPSRSSSSGCPRSARPDAISTHTGSPRNRCPILSSPTTNAPTSGPTITSRIQCGRSWPAAPSPNACSYSKNARPSWWRTLQPTRPNRGGISVQTSIAKYKWASRLPRVRDICFSFYTSYLSCLHTACYVGPRAGVLCNQGERVWDFEECREQRISIFFFFENFCLDWWNIFKYLNCI